MLTDLIDVLEDVQKNPLVEFTHGQWFGTENGEVICACPLTQVAMKLGLKVAPFDSVSHSGTLGSDICEFIERRLNIPDRIVTGIFVSYDRYVSLEDIIAWLKRGDWK